MCCFFLSDTEGPHHKKKRRSRSTAKKQRSLSPLSKRMAMIDTSLDKSHNSQFNHPYGWAAQQTGPPPQQPVEPLPVPVPSVTQDLDYELKVIIFKCHFFFIYYNSIKLNF